MRGIIVGLGLIALLGAGCDGGGGGQECTPEAASACEGGATYWLDSCGERGALLETCACGCDPGGLACLAECPCVPDCAGRECGPDGCGGTCGACGAQERCEAGRCAPVGPCQDACPYADGVLYQCERRFMYGVNWAWKNWCGDFGGISAWGFQGVAADREAFSADMAAMKAAGVNVIRWWMFPRFLSDSISWAAEDAPAGIGGTLVADIQAALELAQEHDLYLMLTLFSFDSFHASADEAGIWSRSIQPMVLDPLKRKALLENLVTPVALAVEASPFKARMLAWDLINEPEWALHGPNPNGGADFEPNGECEAVTHAEMETFLDELAAALRSANPGALLTVGNAAIKWGTAWLHVDQDFYSLHYYDWVYQWFPYDTVTLESVGLTDKPVVIGEYPIQGLSAVGGHPARTSAEYSADMWTWGYAGTLAWAYNDPSFPWDDPTLGAFAADHPCETAW